MNLMMSNKITFKSRLVFFLFFGVFLLGVNQVLFSQTKKFKVVLDAGHGGHDPGNIGYKKYIEKDIALKIVLGVGKILEKEPDIEVIYTRKTDVFVDLWERGNIANRANADLFVSVHCNAHSSQAFGAENFTLGPTNKKNLEIVKKENEVILLEENYEEKYQGYNPNDPESFIGVSMMIEEYLDQSLQLASMVQSNFTKNLKRKDRGVKQAAFVVLYQTSMPSILVETGFLSNKSEGPYLNSKKGQQEFSKAIADGIKTYINQVKLNTVTDDFVETEISSIEFKVQLATSSKKLATKPYNFKGLQDVERMEVNGLYKYFSGGTSNYDQVRENLALAKELGYKDAFIVAYKEGEKISVKQALNDLE